jgi:DNA-binding CsgD family transcriptional regulator
MNLRTTIMQSATTMIADSELERMQRMLERCAGLTQQIGRMPAVATPDWCDRAAAALAAVFPHADAAVLLADLGEAGRLRDVFSIGAGSTRGGRAHKEEAIGLRVRVEGLQGLPWAPDEMRIADDGEVASRVYARAELQGSGHGNCLLVPSNGSLVATAALLAPHARTRKLLSYVILPESTSHAFESMMVVRLGTTLLARLANIAVGTGGEPVQWLTHREQEVLDQLVLGHSVKEISEILGRSPHTIHDHVKSLHRKMNANSRGELVAKALGHVPPTQP